MFKQKFSARSLTLAGAVAMGLATSSGTQALTATANLSVTATVSANCIISTAPVAFGAYDPVFTNHTTALTGQGTVSVTCTSGASTKVTLGEGLHATGASTAAAPARQMNDGGTNNLTYSLYSDNLLTAVWGNTAGTGVAHTGTGLNTDLTVYGSVDPGQNVPSGNYADTVVATVTF